MLAYSQCLIYKLAAQRYLKPHIAGNTLNLEGLFFPIFIVYTNSPGVLDIYGFSTTPRLLCIIH